VFKAHMILYYSRLESNSKEEDVMQLDLDPNGPSAVGKKVRVCERERERGIEGERERESEGEGQRGREGGSCVWAVGVGDYANP